MNPIYTSGNPSAYPGTQPVVENQYNYAIPTQAVPVPNSVPMAGIPAQTAQPIQGVPVQQNLAQPVDGIPVQQILGQPMQYPAGQVPVAGIPTANVVPPMQPASPSIDLLMTFPAVVISEDLISVAALTSNFNEKKFNVYLTNENGEVTPNQSPFLYATESTDCCSCTQTHNFTTDIKFLDGSELYHLETSTKCGLFAMEKHMTIDSPSSGSLGSVRSDEACMSYNFHAYDEHDVECATVSGSKCQCGLFSFNACQGCNRVEFEVQDCVTGTTGSIAKLYAQLGFMNTDCLVVVFPPNSMLAERIRILCAAFLVNSICNSNMDNTHHGGVYATSDGLATGVGVGLLAGHMAGGGYSGGSYYDGGDGEGQIEGPDVDFGGFDGGGCDVDFGGFD